MLCDVGGSGVIVCMDANFKPERGGNAPAGGCPVLVSGLVWSGLVWSGLVWSGLVWSGCWAGSGCRASPPLAKSGVFAEQHTSWRLPGARFWSALVCSGLLWSALVWLLGCAGLGWERVSGILEGTAHGFAQTRMQRDGHCAM